ncbi:hypothetical protein OEZ86_012668 [Tetradesmus obliquus]|nr:hypothetical protein OEZ86_012668 [Tetradesmus obliquus]
MCSSSTSSSATAAKQPVKAGKQTTNLADSEGSPFHELGLAEVNEGMGRVRVRQHVNPLASQYQQPTIIQDWAAVYADPSLPLFVDMGCGPGRFLLLLARRRQQQQQQQQRMNYLGLEIRQPLIERASKWAEELGVSSNLVERANKWAEELGVSSNVHYEWTNVSVSLAALLAAYPGPVSTLAAQFPDPHFKKRHKKRRMVQASVVAAARELLVPGGQVFLQSDVYNAAVSMRDEFEQYAGDVLQLSPLHSPASTFQWTPQQEAAAAAASKQPSDVARRQQQQQQHGDSSQEDSASEATFSSSSSSEQHDSSDNVAAELDSELLSSSEEQFVSSWAAGGWLVDNPLGVPTEREHYVTAQGGKVFRVLLVKQ